jgi:eukaryotic-like serine/threonine-protein kinase
MIVNIAIAPFPAPSILVPELSPEVDRFFERALAKHPAQRFSSAREMAAAFAALAEPKDRGPAKILVIDDEPDVPLLVRQRFRQQIRRSVYEFVFATDGEAALEQLRKHLDIDVVLSDISMPGMDGLTFLSRVAEINPMVQTVMVSAYGDMANIRTAMRTAARSISSSSRSISRTSRQRFRSLSGAWSSCARPRVRPRRTARCGCS